MAATIDVLCVSFFFQAEDGIRDLVRSRGLGDVYKRQGYASTDRTAGDLAVAPRRNAENLGNQIHGIVCRPVSYTHLTLPTIYSV